ncbi:MAG: hypothetical protein KJ043_16535, partial [Anaerolineae bacterium]|nr:hypothetical protein [Anaerolineae bacterium]
VFLIGLVFGNDIAIWASGQKVEAAIRGQSVFELGIFEPIRILFANDSRLIGSILVIFFWPVLFLLFFGMLLGLVIMSGIDTNNRLGIIESFIVPIWWR